MKEWYIEDGPESDVVISSRVRLARNFKDYPFPFKMNKEQKEYILNKTRDAIFDSNSQMSDTFEFIDLKSIDDLNRQEMFEKHLISKELINKDKNSGVILSKDEKISIMINEEDHLRIQCLASGMQINSAWDCCNKIDSLLEEKIDFAFSNTYGYLTCCPTNLGTAIRASVMLHLPALTMTGYIRTILEACGKLGIAVRGLFGENTEAWGDMFQISNQVTLGKTEDDIVTNIKSITYQIIEQERSLRDELYRQNKSRFEDRVFRSLGVLLNARIISSQESLKLLSDVRLGVNMSIIKETETKTLNEILLLIQPANLQKCVGGVLTPDERDIIRANVIREKLENDSRKSI